MASIIWMGEIEGQTYRVVDSGTALTPRLQVEIRAQPDLMGIQGWGRFDPIPTTLFSQMLIAAGVVG